jgi:hypothetical protein
MKRGVEVIDLTDWYVEQWIDEYKRNLVRWSQEKPKKVKRPLAFVIINRGEPVFKYPKYWRHGDLWLCNGFQSERYASNDTRLTLSIGKSPGEGPERCVIHMNVYYNTRVIYSYDIEDSAALAAEFVNAKKTAALFDSALVTRGMVSVWTFFGIRSDMMENHIKTFEERWVKQRNAIERACLASGVDYEFLLKDQPKFLFGVEGKN